MSVSTRWTVVVLVVLVALGAAFWMELRDQPGSTPGADTPTARDHRDADTPEALAGPRAKAALPPCPAPGAGAGPEALRGITLECAADGAPVDVARALAGRPVVLNLWAYWCGPCADELPAMAEYQRRNPGVLVVTVHQDENETAALLRLAELGVRLPTLQDGRRLVAAALRVPNVMPATVVLRADGSVAEILPRPFATADEIATAVDAKIRPDR
ncbi:TlpA family protein disulfide reductase [Mycolicibacterium mageritense]|uniref:Membrane protein n=1 Tax=Mycolicibacterium mageritense TaxID=53462 RepID=A0AAI8TRT4_MYCME|nr:TlpA disulfide reductase family protein [Mycolicibacterium mageritense]MCC9185593.1 TlpA family protein disulfide reductase [Mycolicibacterium mageritense]TXI54878.1 MAG: TlpA family protein disulfide reductase [Mycolicibacterium mageritense]CDO22330.1 thiol-disulfide isomerase-like thioredoxin [Mycolicibacterium mageritense DSM 44476 = CIP 104973]BBX33910.1 membrane protein [Mycolicibacterium mageritense]BDY27563.1 Thiol-disulfide oxidoreductase ResA [Mycolicibacterium mageritense]